MLRDGRVVTNRDLFIEAMALGCKYSSAYNDLGTVLAPEESITLPDGRVMTKRGLYIEAIALDRECSAAYSNLGHLSTRDRNAS